MTEYQTLNGYLLRCINLIFQSFSVKIVVLEKETETVCEMYKLIECYSVPTPPEDIAVFATLPPCITAVRNTIDKAVGERHSYVDKFCQHLQQDINQLNKTVLEVRTQAEVKEKSEGNSDTTSE